MGRCEGEGEDGTGPPRAAKWFSLSSFPLASKQNVAVFWSRTVLRGGFQRLEFEVGPICVS